MSVTNKRDALADLAKASPVNYKKARRIARNTFDYTGVDGLRRIRLHQTDVVTFLPGGRVKLDSGGWRSMTTKERMSGATPYNIRATGGVWNVTRVTESARQSVAYFDGIILPDAFASATRKGAAAVKRDEKTQEAIRKFCAKVRKLDAFPLPGAGDCLICRFESEPIAGERRGGGWHTAGQSGPHDSEHLRSHMREGYIHGTLLVNALRWRGTGDTGIAMYLHGKPSERASIVVNALRRYLRRKLGVG
jgi:hypothetical protein